MLVIRYMVISVKIDLGGFAIHVLAKEKSLRKIPNESGLDEAATIPHAGLLVHQSIELLNNK